MNSRVVRPEDMRQRRRRDGSTVWCVQLYLGRNQITGKPRRPYREFPSARSREEAAEMATAWLDAQLRPLLTDQLLAYVARALKAGQISEQTAVRYEGHVRVHVVPYLPAATVSSVTTAQLGDLYAALLDDGLSQSTVRGLHWFLSGAYSRFMRDGLVDSDPTAEAWHPSPRGGGATSLCVADARTLEAALREVAFPAQAGSARA